MYLPDIPISVAFGGLITASNLPLLKAGIATRDELRRRTLRQVLVYGLLFHCPDSFFAFIWYPDWNLGYLFPFEKVGYFMALVLDLGLLLMLMLGRWLALAAAKRGGGFAWIPISLSFIIFAVILTCVYDRYTHIGTFAEYHAGVAMPTSTDPTFTMFTTLAGAYLIVPLIALLAANLVGAKRSEFPDGNYLNRI